MRMISLLAVAGLFMGQVGVVQADIAVCAESRLKQLTADELLDCFHGPVGARLLASMSVTALSEESNRFFQDVSITGAAESAELVKLFVDERDRRRATLRKSETPYVAFLQAGMISEAERERTSKNLDVPRLDLQALRSAIVPPRLGEIITWEFKGDSINSLAPRIVDISSGPRIIVISAPGCGACNVAAEDIGKDQKLRADFARYAVWLEFPDANFTKEYYDGWNSKYPWASIHGVFSHVGLPVRKEAAVPYLFFLKDGVLIHEMLGWTSENQSRLQTYLHDIGLKVGR